MTKKKTILSLLSLVFTLTVIPISIYFVGQKTGFFSQASPEEEPRDIKVTNISDNSFTVSWMTPDKSVAGFLVYGETEKVGLTASDDRDKTGQIARNTHHATVKNLDPGLTYYFKIGSGAKAYDNNGKSFSVETAPTTNDPPALADPAFGKVTNSQGAPVADALVYLTVAGGTPLSTYTRADGNWLITLNNARTADLESYIAYKTEGDKIDIFVNAPAGTVEATADTNNVRPMQTVALGQTYTFGKLGDTAKVEATAPAQTKSTDFSLQNINATSESSIPLEILAPSEDSTVSTTKPTFTGTGKPGEVITITIHSTTAITAQVTVGSDGKWVYTPIQDLSSGDHTVTIAQGTSSDTAQFSVLGTSTVTKAATQSDVSTPVAGNLSYTIVLAVIGMAVLLLGVFLSLTL